MTQPPVLRPENAVLLAVLVIGAAVAAAILMLLGVLRMGLLSGIALLVACGVAASLILVYSRKLRREQRPEWLETHAWRKGLIDKLHEGETPPGKKPDS